MGPLLALLLFCYSTMAQNSQPPGPASPPEPPMNTTVCMVAEYQSSIAAQTLRVRGHVYRVFDQLIIRNDGCRLVLELPSASAPVTGERSKTTTVLGKSVVLGPDQYNLKSLLRYVNARVTPIKKGAVCLVCGRYHVRATIIGHLQALKEPKSDGPVESDAIHNPASLRKPTARHLVISSVSNVTASDLYGKFYNPDEFRPVSSD